MNASFEPMTQSLDSNSATTPPPPQLLPVPVPDWSLARTAWSHSWPTHVYGFGCAFLLAAALSLVLPPYCFRCRRSPRPTVATSTVNGIVGVVCLTQSCVLLVDAYHSTGRLPVALVQMVHGLVFPGVVATLTILDRIFSALVKPRQHVGSIKHPRLIATALTIYLLSTSATYLVISVRPQTRLWLLLCQAVSLAWGCAAVFLVSCQCLRLARFARVTARSRRQTAVYIRAKRRLQQRLDAALDSERRCELLRHLARLRVARTKADEFLQQQQQQQQRVSSLDEQGFSDIDLQVDITTTNSSDQLPSDVEVTKTTTVKLSRNHFRYRRRSRRRRHVTGSRSAYAVRDFTVTALAAARLLWSPSPDSDGRCDESSSWQVCLHPTECQDVADCRCRKLNDSATCDRKRHNRRTSVTGTDSDSDVENDVEETDSSSESRQHPTTDVTNTEARPASENIKTTGRGAGYAATESDEARALTRRQQQEPASFIGDARDRRPKMSSADASSTTCLLLESAGAAARPLSRRLTTATARLLRHAAAPWRESRDVTSPSVGDVESRGRIACVAESYMLNAGRDVRRDADGGSGSSSMLSTGRRRRRSHDAVMFENRAYDGRDDVTGCEEAVDSVEPGTSVQSAAAADDCRQASSGYLADTELDSLDWRHDLDAATSSSLPLPGSSVYLGLSRLRGGRTVRLVWRTASVAVTSASVVCCLHIYSMLGVFGVLSNDRPAPAWPWFGFQTLYRYSTHHQLAFTVLCIYKVAVSLCLCVCLPDFSKTCGPISMKLFMVHRGHR